MPSDTVQIPALKAQKRNERMKVWIPVITAAISLIGTITVGVLQTYSASVDDTKAIMKDLQEIQKHTNEQVIPLLQEAISSCKERIAKLEGKLEILVSQQDKAAARRHASRGEEVRLPKTLLEKLIGTDRVHGFVKTMAEPKDKEFKIPKLELPQQQAQQVMPTIEH